MRWNLPNLLTLARLALLPVVLWLLWPEHITPLNGFWASIAYIMAGILDIADGALARRTNQVTVLGKFLDPLVDKLFYLVTLIALLQLPGPWIPPWVVMVVLVRELAVTGLRGIAGNEGIVLAADEGGKIKTLFATAGVVGLMWHHAYQLQWGPVRLHLDAGLVGLQLTYLSLVLSVWSGGRYVYKFAEAIKASAVL